MDGSKLRRLIVNVLLFLSAEVFLYAFGMMLFPPPRVIVLMMLAAAFFLVGFKLDQSRAAQSQVRKLLGSLPPRARPSSRVVSWSALALVVLALWMGLGGFAEALLWQSGNFGEPPGNRVLRITRLGHSFLVELGVRTTPIQAQNFALVFADNVERSDLKEFSFGQPLLGEFPPEWNREHPSLQSMFFSVQHVANELQFYRINSVLSNERSFYLLVSASLPIINCKMSTTDEWWSDWWCSPQSLKQAEESEGTLELELARIR